MSPAHPANSPADDDAPAGRRTGAADDGVGDHDLAYVGSGDGDVGDEPAHSGPAAPAVSPADVGAIPTAADLRRYVRAAGRAHSGAGIGSLLSDVYYAVVTLAIGVGVGLGVAQQMRVSLPPAPEVDDLGLSLPTLVLVVVVALAGVALSLAGRLGPVGLGGAQAAWLQSLPVGRRGLLRPAAVRLPLAAAAVGAVLVAILDAGLLADSGGHVLRAASTAAVGGALVVLGAGLAQAAGVARRRTAAAGDALLVLAPLLAWALALTGTSLTGLPVPGWPVVAALVVAVAAGGAALDARLVRIPGRSLRESGSVAEQAAGALVSLDSRELGRALSDATSAPTRRWTSSLITARGPISALVTADLVVLRRSTRHVVQLIVAALVPALVTVVPQLAAPGSVLIALLLGGWAAASATGEGARRAEMAPILDRLLPLSARTVRRLRMVVPTAVMVVWALAVHAALGRWASDLPGWLALAVAGAPAWGAATVRAAYRPAPDWGKNVVATPMGALPGGVAGVLARGPDIVVLGLLPTWIAVLLQQVTTPLLMIQAALSVIGVLVASSTSTKSLMDRLAEAQDQDARARGR